MVQQELPHHSLEDERSDPLHRFGNRAYVRLAVQGATIKEHKGSEEKGRALHFAQCFFAADEFARSVSLTVIRGNGDNAGAGQARAYWEDTFRGQKVHVATVSPARIRQKNPPRAIPDAGEEAFWTGDARAGALYVLSDQVVLRVSVGGVADEEERIRRSTALARAALQRLLQ